MIFNVAIKVIGASYFLDFVTTYLIQWYYRDWNYIFALLSLYDAINFYVIFDQYVYDIRILPTILNWWIRSKFENEFEPHFYNLHWSRVLGLNERT